MLYYSLYDLNPDSRCCRKKFGEKAKHTAKNSKAAKARIFTFLRLSKIFASQEFL